MCGKWATNEIAQTFPPWAAACVPLFLILDYPVTLIYKMVQKVPHACCSLVHWKALWHEKPATKEVQLPYLPYCTERPWGERECWWQRDYEGRDRESLLVLCPTSSSTEPPGVVVTPFWISRSRWTTLVTDIWCSQEPSLLRTIKFQNYGKINICCWFKAGRVGVICYIVTDSSCIVI